MVSTLSSILGNRPARERSFKAKSRPPSTNFRLARSTVHNPVCKSSAISRSVLPSSAKSKTLTRLIFRALGYPLLVNTTNNCFSSLVKSTMYFFVMGLSSQQAFGKF
jgi:hypothetical protein